MTELTKIDRTRIHNPPIRWFWIRHAPSFVAKGVFTGKSDVSALLDAAQRKAVAELASALPYPRLMVSSALKRARQTAQKITEEIMQDAIEKKQSVSQRKIEHKIDPALDEQNFGDWEGQPYDEVIHRAMWRAPTTFRPPNGESFADLLQRVENAVERIENALRTRSARQKNTQKNTQADAQENAMVVVAVAHAGTVRAALASALSLSPKGALSFVVDPLSLTIIERYKTCEGEAKAQARVLAVNVRTHRDIE